MRGKLIKRSYTSNPHCSFSKSNLIVQGIPIEIGIPLIYSFFDKHYWLRLDLRVLSHRSLKIHSMAFDEDISFIEGMFPLMNF